MSPASRRRLIDQITEKLGVSQRKVCKVLGQNRSTQRYELKMPRKDAALITAIEEQKSKRNHRRYGYRRICEILCRMGYLVNHKRVYRLWVQCGFNLPKKQRKRKHFNGNSANACDQKWAEYMNHVWSYDIVENKLENGRKVRMLNVIDEFTRESLSIDVGFRITGYVVTEVLRYLFNVRGEPDYIRSDNGPEFIAEKVKKFLAESGVETLYIEPGSPWENGYVESFNSKLLHSHQMRHPKHTYRHYRQKHLLVKSSIVSFVDSARSCTKVCIVFLPK